MYTPDTLALTQLIQESALITDDRRRSLLQILSQLDTARREQLFLLLAEQSSATGRIVQRVAWGAESRGDAATLQAVATEIDGAVRALRTGEEEAELDQQDADTFFSEGQ